MYPPSTTHLFNMLRAPKSKLADLTTAALWNELPGQACCTITQTRAQKQALIVLRYGVPGYKCRDCTQAFGDPSSRTRHIMERHVSKAKGADDAEPSDIDEKLDKASRRSRLKLVRLTMSRKEIIYGRLCLMDSH
ncbi:hypothetical protein BDQ17DRAFT_913295 [Cyathus striatus]|nr:hypothetical protein BDQ17DRAFT_913295 [Cyathus striatus]